MTNLSCSGPFICKIPDLEHTNDLSGNKQNHRVSEDIVKCTTVSLSRGKAYVFRETDKGRNCQKTETRTLLSKRSDESSTSLGSNDQDSGGSVERSNELRTKDQNGGGGVLRNTDLETIDTNNGESVKRSSRLGTRDKNSGKSVYRSTSLETRDKNSGKSVETSSRVKTRDNNSEKGVDGSTSLETRDRNIGERVYRSTSLETRDKSSGESVERSSRLGTRDKGSVDRSTSLETTVKKIWESVERSSMVEIRDHNSGKSVQMSTRLETRDQTSGKRKKLTGKTGTCAYTELKQCSIFNMPKDKLSAAGVMLSTPQCWTSSVEEDPLKLLSPIVNVECTPAVESSKKRKSDKPLSSFNSAHVDPGLFQVVHQISPRGVYNKTEQVIKQQHVDERDDSILSSCIKDCLNESPLFARNACLVANTSVNSKEKTLEAQDCHAENISTTEVTNRETGIQNFNKIESEAEQFRVQRHVGYEKVRSRKKNKPIYNRELASIMAGNDVNVSTEDHSGLRKRQKIDYTATKF